MSSASENDRTPRVRAYVTAVCEPKLADEAVSAAFVDFLARTRESPVSGPELDRVLLAATRSAAAGRFTVVAPAGHAGLVVSAECRAMPELLALHANGELSGDEQLLVDHLAGCAVCAHTLDRIQRAEEAFAHAAGELPELEIEPTTVDISKARPRAAPARRVEPSTTRSRAPRPAPDSGRSNPQPERETRPNTGPTAAAIEAARVAGPGPTTYRRRSGGLVGAIRRLGRPPR